MFDPNSWEPARHEFRIYGDDRAHAACIVDEEDYRWAVQWKWHVNKPHPTRNGKKQYFVRSQGAGGRTKPRLYLHVEIMKRTGIVPPTELHKLVDHLDGNEWNCKRNNLRWATSKQNRSNLYGQHGLSI